MVYVRKIMSFADIIIDFIRVSEFSKFKDVSYKDDNPAYSQNFWRLYKNKESALWEAFPEGKVWKKPNTNQWRFYFNLNGRKPSAIKPYKPDEKEIENLMKIIWDDEEDFEHEIDEVADEIIEESEKPKICPRCKKEYTGYPALSRKDNKTKICPACGQEEALEDFARHQRKEKKDDFSGFLNGLDKVKLDKSDKNVTEEKKEYGYCESCKGKQEQKRHPMQYHRESGQHSQDFECLRCHRVKRVWI